MPAQAPRLRQHAPPDTALFITDHSAAEGRLRHEFAGEADEQTHVHARLDWVHPIHNELERALHDPMHLVEQWIRDISETVAALPHKQGTLVDLVVGLELQFKTIAWFQVVDGSALLRRQVSDPVYEEWQADRS